LPNDHAVAGKEITPAYLLGIGSKRDCALFVSAHFTIVHYVKATADMLSCTGERGALQATILTYGGSAGVLPAAVGG
jgi:hypothetical protein